MQGRTCVCQFDIRFLSLIGHIQRRTQLVTAVLATSQCTESNCSWIQPAYATH
jgi:hypothetical protein